MSGVEWSGIADTYRVRYSDGSEQEVRTTLADAFVFEKTEHKKVIGENNGLTGVMKIIWLALKRTGQQEGIDFEGWAARVDDFGKVDTDDGKPETDPTP